MENKKFEQLQDKISYDERKKILTIQKFGENDEGKNSQIFTFEGEEKIRGFIGRIRADKAKDEKLIQDSEKNLSDMEDQQVKLKKEIPKLTKDQEKLMNDIEALGKYDPLNKVNKQVEQMSKNIKNLKESHQTNKTSLNEIESKIKFKI